MWLAAAAPELKKVNSHGNLSPGAAVGSGNLLLALRL
jgi:hypothetical protein